MVDSDMKNLTVLRPSVIHLVGDLVEKEEEEEETYVVVEPLETEAEGKAVKRPILLGSFVLGSSRHRVPSVKSKATTSFLDQQVIRFSDFST